MKKSTALLTLFSAFVTSSAFADWTIASGYTSYVDRDNVLDVTLGAVHAGIGYEYQFEGFRVIPELKMGIGVNDDKVGTVEASLDYFVSLNLRGAYEISSSSRLFLQPSLNRSKTSASQLRVSENDWELGLGAGFEFDVSEQSSIEFSFDHYEDKWLYSAGIRYRF